MSTKWIWLLLILLELFEYAESTATKWISPIGANTGNTGFPPDKLTFAMIKAGVNNIIAVAADENDVMDFLDAESENICPQGSTPTNTALDNHEILAMEYVGPDVCAIKLSEEQTIYVPNTAGTIAGSDLTLSGYNYYMVQTEDIQITIPNRNAEIDSEIGTFTLSESDKTATEIRTICNDPNFNGNLRYIYNENRILLADPVDKRVKSNWNEIVCLLKIKRNDDKMEYARATVNLQDQNDPTAPICKLFPTHPDYTGSPEVGMLYFGKQGATCTITSNPVDMFTQTTPDSCDTTITLASGQDIETTTPSVTVLGNDGESVTCSLQVVVLLEPLECLSTNVATVSLTVHRYKFDLEFEDVILRNRLTVHESDTITYALSEEYRDKFEIEAGSKRLKIKSSAIASLEDGNHLVNYVATKEAVPQSVTCTLTIAVESYGTECENT